MGDDMTSERTDWDEILVAKDVRTRLEALQETGELRTVFPSLQRLVGFGGEGTGHKDLWAHTTKVVEQTVPRPLLRWASLFHDVGKPVSYRCVDGHISFHHHEAESAKIFRAVAKKSRLFQKAEIDEISFVIHNLGHVESYEPSWTDSAVRRAAGALGPHMDSVFAVARADCTTARPEKRRKQLLRTKELRDRIESLRALDAIPPALPKGLGQALMASLGLSPGPELGNVVKELRGRVEAGELPRNAEISVYLKAL